MPPLTCPASPYAGSWYPADLSELRGLLARLFDASQARTGRFLASRPLGFVVPHAGLRYSGTVAAAAYRHLRAAPPEKVVLLGFMHRDAPAGCWIPEADAYRTPLGDVDVDGEAVAGLAASGQFGRLALEVLRDHSVELQLPLLREAAPGTRIVPVYVGRLGSAARGAAAGMLAELARSGALLVASSDFTHFGARFRYEPFPVDERTADRLRLLDQGAMRAASSLRPELFLQAVRTSGATVCGVQPIALLLETLALLESGEEEIFQEMLDYQSSGEITGDFSHSVSYAALGYFPHPSFELEPEDQALLLGSVRSTLRGYLATGERRPLPPESLTAGLERRGGAYVALRRAGRLRGCVGRRAATQPLGITVPELALCAALEDRRFPPVAPGETGLEAEVDVLTPLKLVRDRHEVRAGAHGVVLETGQRRALLLPHVASDRGWSAEPFLAALADKAGAPPEVYEDPATRLLVFRAQRLRDAERL